MLKICARILGLYNDEYTRHRNEMVTGISNCIFGDRDRNQDLLCKMQYAGTGVGKVTSATPFYVEIHL
jgi:hypothetical protein